MGRDRIGDHKSGRENLSSPHPFTLLFVCTGNVCRTPMAIGSLRSLVSDELQKGLKVISAGTAALPGKQAASPAISVVAENGIDISDHRSRPLTKELLDEADLVLTMSIEHNDYIKGMGMGYLEKTFLLKEFGHLPTGDERDLSIHDPLGGTEETYRKCFQEIKAEIERILPEIEKLCRER